MQYTVELLRVTGIYKTGKYAHTGTITFAKEENLTSAKEYVADTMKRGYYNYASIYDRETDVAIERFIGQEWKIVS